MSAPELKPCPFCGGEAALTNREMPGCAFVICMGCQAQGDDGSIERVAAKWNTRADLCTPTDEQVKALEAALQTFIYETAHLSPLEDDGSHWCKISAECLEKGRAALRDMGEG